jgi:HEAT repeat protein
MQQARFEVRGFYLPNLQSCVRRFVGIRGARARFFKQILLKESDSVALGRLSDSLAVAPLMGALKDRDRQVREVSASALGFAKEPRAIEALIAALHDHYASAPINAAHSLGISRNRAALGSVCRG